MHSTDPSLRSEISSAPTTAEFEKERAHYSTLDSLFSQQEDKNDVLLNCSCLTFIQGQAVGPY